MSLDASTSAFSCEMGDAQVWLAPGAGVLDHEYNNIYQSPLI